MSSPSSTSSHSRSVRRRILRYLRRSTVSGPLSTPLALITGRNLATTSSRLSAPTSQESPYSRETSSFSVNSSSSNSSGRIDEGFHQTQQQKLSSAILSEECVCTAAGNVLLQLAYFSAKCILTAVRERDPYPTSLLNYLSFPLGSVDFLSKLPIEIADIILSHCDASTLLTISLVCKTWRTLSLDNLLWRRLYMSHPHWVVKPSRLSPSEETKTTTTTNMIDYRSLYQRRTQLEQRWKAENKQDRIVLGHADSIYCVQFDSEKLVTGSRDRTIKCWDMQGRCLRTLTGHYASVLCLQYDDTLMVSGSSDHTVIMWNMQTYEIVRRLRGHASGVLDVGFDDRIIASCSKDATIRIWKRQDGSPLRTLSGHRGPVNAIQFCGSRLVSASGDAVIKLWDLETGQCIRDFVGHSRGLACIRFDGRRIVSGSNDNKIKVWDAGTYLQG